MGRTTEVKHSQTKNAWNVIGNRLGGKYKVARLPYVLTGLENIDEFNKNEAYEDAVFISKCINHKDQIENVLNSNML